MKKMRRAAALLLAVLMSFTAAACDQSAGTASARVLRGDGLAGGDERGNLAAAGGRYADLVGGKHRHGG